MKNFAGIDKQFAAYETAEILLQSIPYDGTSTWIKGANKGFLAFLEAAEIASESDTPAVIIELNEQTVLAVSDPEDGFDAGLPAICVVM